jgi:endo-1,4-beta-D-glucanase Y
MHGVRLTLLKKVRGNYKRGEFRLKNRKLIENRFWKITSLVIVFVILLSNAFGNGGSIAKAEDVEHNSKNSKAIINTEKISKEKVPRKGFPQHATYSKGIIKPNHISQTKMDKEVARLYNEWKSKYLKKNPYNANQYYVWYSDGDWFKEGDDDDKIAITVSEAHGYGMLITALMAGSDKEAKTYFDGMYRYFRAHPSAINKDLMAWRQGEKDGKIIDISGVDSATDGDMDIAYALLLADKQWGSEGKINYFSEAKKVIDAIMKDDVNQTDWNLKVGDWASGKDAELTRTSDYMMSHLKAFREVSGDSRWDKVIDQTYEIINEVYKNYSLKTGLLPDFLVLEKGKFIPPVGVALETEEDGSMGYNACRTSWRVATDYLMTGDNRAIAQLNKLNQWIRKNTNNNPKNIKAGYKLDGTLIEGRDYEDITFSSPFMVSAMVKKSNQEWLNDLWDYNLKIKTEEDFYFGNTIRLLNTIVVSGNWWSPIE